MSKKKASTQSAKSKEKPEPEIADFFVATMSNIPDDEGLESLCPTLYGILMPRFKDGSCTRQSGTIRIRIDGSYYRVSVECPTEKRVTHILALHLVGILEYVEDEIRSGRAVWVPTYDAVKDRKKIVVD